MHPSERGRAIRPFHHGQGPRVPSRADPYRQGWGAVRANESRSCFLLLMALDLCFFSLVRGAGRRRHAILKGRPRWRSLNENVLHLEARSEVDPRQCMASDASLDLCFFSLVRGAGRRRHAVLRGRSVLIKETRRGDYHVADARPISCLGSLYRVDSTRVDCLAAGRVDRGTPV